MDFNRAERRAIEQGKGRHEPFIDIRTISDATEYCFMRLCNHPTAFDAQYASRYMFIHGQAFSYDDLNDELEDDYRHSW